MKEKILKAKEFATKCHADTNHLYNGQPYSVHLKMVFDCAEEYIDLLGHILETKTEILSACWLHDVIEDCRITYNDIKSEFGFMVAEIVYALTNEKGRNRKERASDNYYKGIRTIPYADFVKLCDRLANIKYSAKQRDIGKMSMYSKEQKHFKDMLYADKFRAMFEEMDYWLSN